MQGNVKATPAETVTSTISVPLRYHNTISQQGSFFRTLKSHGVSVDHSLQPPKASTPARPAPSARIDDVADGTEPEWQVVPNSPEGEEVQSVWTLKARDQAGLDMAETLIKQAIERRVASVPCRLPHYARPIDVPPHCWHQGRQCRASSAMKPVLTSLSVARTALLSSLVCAVSIYTSNVC